MPGFFVLISCAGLNRLLSGQMCRAVVPRETGVGFVLRCKIFGE
jgi:hypothetical protein